MNQYKNNNPYSKSLEFSDSIDFRSDTLTIPSAAMLESVQGAKLGDDVYGEDPTVKKLESFIANYFGMEQAMFFPSGTMANQTAIKLHTNPGDQVIAHEYSHIYNYEGGGASFNSGVSFKLLKGEKGFFSSDQLSDAINPKAFYHAPLSKLVCLENTTNKGGGACWDVSDFDEINSVCKKNNLLLEKLAKPKFKKRVKLYHSTTKFPPQIEELNLETLEKYLDARWLDQQNVLAFTKLIPKLFATDSHPWAIGRNVGLLLMDLSHPLRRVFAKFGMGL